MYLFAKRWLIGTAIQKEAEINNGERPALASMPENVEQYDTIFIGYPIWWDRVQQW